MIRDEIDVVATHKNTHWPAATLLSFFISIISDKLAQLTFRPVASNHVLVDFCVFYTWIEGIFRRALAKTKMIYRICKNMASGERALQRERRRQGNLWIIVFEAGGLILERGNVNMESIMCIDRGLPELPDYGSQKTN